jgi:hypothetical protein
MAMSALHSEPTADVTRKRPTWNSRPRCVRRLLLATLMASFVLSSGCWMRHADPLTTDGGTMADEIFFNPYFGNEAFVGVPTDAGTLIMLPPGWVLGGVGYAIAWPFDARFSSHPGDVYIFTVIACRLLGGAVVGLPFWIVKKVTWDAPYAFGRFVNLAVRSPRGRVDYLVERLAELEAEKDDTGGLYFSYKRRMLLTEVDEKLRKLTGQKTQCNAAGWRDWWQRHRDDFDSGMNPAAPKAAPQDGH